MSSTADQKAVNYCPYHRRKENPVEQCIIFRRLPNEKFKAGEILLLEGGAMNIHESPFQRH